MFNEWIRQWRRKWWWKPQEVPSHLHVRVKSTLWRKFDRRKVSLLFINCEKTTQSMCDTYITVFTYVLQGQRGRDGKTMNNRLLSLVVESNGCLMVILTLLMILPFHSRGTPSFCPSGLDLSYNTFKQNRLIVCKSDSEISCNVLSTISYTPP